MVVSIILLNWNGRRFVRDCARSVLEQTYPEIEFIVVDNASMDGSPELLLEDFPQIKMVRNSENLGFSRAMNQGIKTSRGSYILSLNYDVILEKDFVEQMVKAIEADERIGSVSGKLLRLNENGKTNIIDSTGHVIFNNRYVINRGEDKEDTGHYDHGDFVFGTCGAAPLYRREMLEDIKVGEEYFDESFFAMLEDVDLDWRAQLRGWKCVYIPDAIAYHYRSASGLQKSRLIQRHYYKNRYLTILKNDRVRSVLKYAPTIFLMDLYLSLDLIMTSPPALFLAWWDLLHLFPEALRKRREIQSRRLVDQREIEKWFQKYRFMDDIRRKLKVKG